MQHPFEEAVETFPDLGRIAGLVRKLRRDLGPDAVSLVLEDSVRFRKVDSATIEVAKAVRKLFDRHGRRRPTKGMEFAVTDADYDSYNVRRPVLEQEEQWVAVFTKFATAFNCGMNILLADWHGRIQAIRTWLQADPQLANLLKGSCFPLLIPAMPELKGDEKYDYGTELESGFLPYVAEAYQAAFLGRPFTNYRQGELAGQVMLLPESRQGELLKRRSEGVVSALWFPQALQGYSVLADREQMATLPHPERIILGGAIEAAVAMMAFPNELAFSASTPLYDLAACQWQSAECSLCFRANGGELRFDGGVGLDGAGSGYSGGLLVLG